MKHAALAGALLFAACAGPRGADGADGDVGPQGKTGPTGAMGADGRDGADGKDGAPGKDGENGLDVVASVLCQGDVPSGGAAPSLIYDIVEYSNGDALVSCSVADGAYQSSATTFYDAKQNGAADLGCVVVRDDGDGTAGFWTFEMHNGVYSAMYNDHGSSNDGYVLTFVDCLTSAP